MPNLEVDHVVILKDEHVPRNQWPLGIIDKVFPGEDGLVRKVQVCVNKDGKRSVYVRPIKEVILLL